MSLAPPLKGVQMDYDIDFLNRVLDEGGLRGEWIRVVPQDTSNWEYIYYGRESTMYFETVKDCLAFVGRELNRKPEERFTT